MNRKILNNVVDLKHHVVHENLGRPDILVVNLGEAKRYPAQAPSLVFADSHHKGDAEHVTFLSRGQMFLARVVTAFLIPLILIQPVGRAYADEVAEAPQQDAAPAAVEAPPQEIPLAVAEVASGEITPPVPPAEGVPPSPTENVNAGSVEWSTSSSHSSADEPASTTDPISTTPSEEIPPVDGGGSGFGGTGGGDAGGGSLPGEGGATGGESGGGRSTTTAPESAIEGPPQSGTTSEVMLQTEEVVEQPSGDVDNNAPIHGEESPIMQKSAEDAAADEALRTERMRDEMRKEVEQEFLRGCISFEASGYYCLTDGARKIVATDTSKVVTTVMSEEGDGGDKEIFAMRNGVRTVLTANDWDDAFPSGDASGEQFVWQGMEGGRWQIFTGSFTASGTQSVTQVTDSRESNFNPKIDGEHIVWQGWADENWEIFMATKRDSKSPFAGEHLPEGNLLLNVGPEWSVERLTKNEEHDMFPSLHGDLVTWQSHVGKDWVVNAYSISSGKTTQLSAPGTKGENPRFTLTWEERDQAGNAHLVGYDISTGAKTDITSESMHLPQSPYAPPNPIPTTQTDQATLPPPPNTGSSTPQKGDDEGGDNPTLP